MFRNLISKSSLIAKGTTISKQLLFKRPYRIISSVKSSIKDDPKNSSNPSDEKISDFKDIEGIEKLMLNKGIYNIYIVYHFYNNNSHL